METPGVRPNRLIMGLARSFFTLVLARTTRGLSGGELVRSTIVFSPHFDDETLGCGGTIIQKKKMGANVKIVFMTDGSKSHHKFIPEDQLKAIRACEALAAGRTLGLCSDDIFLLGFEDTRLIDHMDSAVELVAGALARLQPDEVFVPYRNEGHSDHHATWKIVLSALRLHGREVTVNEYPIWLWLFWPWTSQRMSPRRMALKRVKISLGRSFRLLRDFRYAVYVGDVLALKRAALQQYRSQMERLVPGLNWPVLADVANGEFLNCFFHQHEIFCRYRYPLRGGSWKH